MAQRAFSSPLSGTVLACATLLACRPADDLPPVRAQGAVFSYAADHEVCAGTVEYGDRWMMDVAPRLGISPDELLPTTYYRLSMDEAGERCGDGAYACARKGDGAIRIFAQGPLVKHELVHAIHLSAWPRRRPLLTEGLAVVFDDSNRNRFDDARRLAEYDEFEIDDLLEMEHPESEVYFVGSWIVYWIIQRHGGEALREFWLADAMDGSAEDFRALFELHFGESLDAMLEDVAGQPACPWMSCVGDIVPWQGDLWASESPTNCDHGVVTGDESAMVREVLVEVPESGPYTVAVSESELGLLQGVKIHPCGGPCGQTADGRSAFYAGETVDVVWDAGLYRVGMAKLGPDDQGIRVEIRPQ